MNDMTLISVMTPRRILALTSTYNKLWFGGSLYCKFSAC